MGHAKKRKMMIDDGLSKIWKNADDIILKFFNEHKKCMFGDIFSYVNVELGPEKKYSRKGFSLRLDNFVDSGIIVRSPTKQGHFIYSITKKGKNSISMLALESRFLAKGLLRTNFENDSSKNTKEYFLERMINRMGVYMLFSCIEGMLKFTSMKNSHDANINNMKTWLGGINPGMEITQYLSEISSNFIKFRDDYEAFSSVYSDKNRLKIIKKIQELIKKKHPEEYQFLTYGIKQVKKTTKEQKEFSKRINLNKHLNELKYNYKLSKETF